MYGSFDELDGGGGGTVTYDVIVSVEVSFIEWVGSLVEMLFAPAVTVYVTGINTVLTLQADALVAKSKYSTNVYSTPKTIKRRMIKTMSDRKV
jgi:hypothetical protein